MPQHETRTSFKSGNKAAEGNDKTQRMSTYIEAALEKTLGELDLGTMEGYETSMKIKEVLATKFIRRTLKAKDDSVFDKLMNSLMDRTEGKPKQATEISGPDGGPIELSNMTEEQLTAIIKAANEAK